MAGTPKILFGPAALTNTYTTNVYAGAGGSALIFDLLKEIHVVNKTSGTVTFRLFLGATGANVAGTELFYDQEVQSFRTFSKYWGGQGLKLLSTDFLVGGASASTSLTIIGLGDKIVV